MPRYVDANSAPIYLNADACEQIKYMPTVDVVEVVHGHWIRQDESFTRYKCSNPECGAENYGGFENYCPNCGAKMDMEEHSG